VPVQYDTIFHQHKKHTYKHVYIYNGNVFCWHTSKLDLIPFHTIVIYCEKPLLSHHIIQNVSTIVVLAI